MDKHEKDFIPIPEAWSQKIRFNINFPKYVNEGEIGVNLKRVSLLCYLGGMSSLRVVSVSGEEKQEEAPQIVGFTSNGEAYAGASRASTRTSLISVGSNSQKEGFASLLQERWIDGVIKINMNAATNQISRDRHWSKGTRDTEAWAQVVDKSVRKGLNEIGVNHLLFDRNSNDKVQFLMATAFSMLNASGIPVLLGPIQPHMPTPEGFVSDLMIRFGILNILFFMLNIPKRLFGNEGYRMSFFLGAQPEYALALKIFSQRRLVKKLESTN